MLQGPRGRLILGIAFAVILVIVIALVVKDCQRDQLEDSYTEYINGVAAAVSTSAEQGAALRQFLRCGAADVGRGTGDEGNPILKSFHIRPIVY